MSKILNRTANNAEIFLHVGLHKTATTFLQAYIFPNIQGINFYNRQFDPVKLFEAEDFILISNEGMSGCPYLLDVIDYYEQFTRSIDKLICLFSSPKLIICFREPAGFVHSAYKQYLHEGGTLKWNDFISIDHKSKLDLDTFLLGKYVKYLEDNIPQDSLFIYDFDSFKTHPELVVKEMIRFITGKYTPIKTGRKKNPIVRYH